MQYYDKTLDPNLYEIALKRNQLIYDFPWKHNEIFGYLQLSIGSISEVFIKIDGDLFTPQKNIYTQKRKIIGNGKVFESRIYNHQNSEQIFNKLLSELEGFKKDPSLKKHYFYLDDLKRIGPFIDWHAFLGFK